MDLLYANIFEATRPSETDAENNSRPPSVFITGAGNGIGAGCARLFAQRGWRVALADVDQSAAQHILRTLSAKSQHEQHIAVKIDVSKESSVKAAVAKVMKSFGKIDAAINCAGIEGDRAWMHNIDETTFDRVFAVNVKGVFLSMKHELRAMLNSGGKGQSIVNIASSAGISPFPEFSSYAASKSAVIGFTKTAAMEYIGRGIRINAIAPATIATPMVQRFSDRWPQWQAETNASYGIGRIGTVEEVTMHCIRESTLARARHPISLLLRISHVQKRANISMCWHWNTLLTLNPS